MAALHLTIDSVDNASAYVASMPAKASKSPASWIKFIGQTRKHIGPGRLAGTTNYTEANVAAILRDFLQPDTKMSLEAATKSLLVMIPAHAPESAEVHSFGEICVELAEQIPYHHPSQLKLVQLLRYLSRSPKFTSKTTLLHRTLSPTVWVNFHAFVANLYETGIWGAQPGYAIMLMRDALEEEKSKEAWEQDCNVMAAAQWIIWYGQSLFKQILYDHDEEDAANKTGSWRLGKLFAGPPMESRSVGRWHFWKDCFEAIGADPGSSDECRKLASKSAGLMGSIEKNMVF